MKELSIKEKTKRYDEALTKARNIVNSINVGLIVKDSFEAVFPELKESEEESIRKRLIELLKKNDEQHYAKEIAWLEKQFTPQVRTGLEWVNTIDDACDKRYSEEYAHGAYCHEQSFKWGFQEGVDWLEKQGEQILANSAKTCKDEQKPIDKVEPTFKTGDWVVWDNKISCHVDDIYQGKESLMYTITDVHNMTRSYSVKGFDNNAHLWTIEDAKDGDMLYLQKNGKEHIIIYKGVIKERFRTFVSAYCAYNGIVDAFCFADVSRYIDIAYGGIMPATKEQRDKLEKAMLKAGYKWNAEKKELRKIEQKPAWS